MSNKTWLPQHDEIPAGQRAFEIVSLTTACSLLIWHVLTLAATADLDWYWAVIVVLAGVAAADLVSGLIHWFADTWGSETMPVLGRRLLWPFRVHHINPRDFLRRDWIDTSGDVAALVAVFLAAGLLLPVDQTFGQAGRLFLIAFAVGGLPANQVHQWAHMPHPPRVVVFLQRTGLILGRRAHAEHHRKPHTTNYCLATGWMNPIASAVDLFPRLERLVQRATGVPPRGDYDRFLGKIEALRQEATASQGAAHVR